MSEAEHLAGALRGLFSSHGWFPAFKHATAGLTARQGATLLAPGYYSVWQLVNHIRFNHEMLYYVILGEPIDWVELGAERRDGWPPQGAPDDESAWEEARNRALRANEQLAELVKTLTAEALERPITAGGANARKLVHGLIAHDSYHTGQIVLVRRLLNMWDMGWREGESGTSVTNDRAMP